MFDFLRGLTKSDDALARLKERFLPLKRAGTSHQRIEEMLSAYIDGELSASEVELVERHLKECATCARNLETLRATVELVRQLPRVPAPRSFTITPAVQPLRLKPRWGYAYLRGATALVAILLVIALSVDILSQQFLVGAPAGRVIAPSPALEMKAATREPETEIALEAMPSPELRAEATLTPQAMAPPAPKPTPEALPQEVSAAVPQPARPWLRHLRHIEFTLLLALIALTATTIAARRRRRG